MFHGSQLSTLFLCWSFFQKIVVKLSGSPNSEPKPVTKLSVKEHFVYTDSEGALYHFLVEGSGFLDASRIPPEVLLLTIVFLCPRKQSLGGI